MSNMKEVSFIGAMSALIHNGRLIREAEKILTSAVDNGIYIYIENPDGTTVKLQKGFKLKDYEIVPIVAK